MSTFLLICMMFSSVVIAYSQQHTVLVDIFTNSHCGPCASMHAAVEASISTTSRASRIVIVYNHLATYSDDAIYQANKSEPLLRAKWYGFSSGTPTTFFDGQKQTSGYGAWNEALDGLIEQPLAYVIEPNLTAHGDSLVLSYYISRKIGAPSVQEALYVVLVEDVTYTGRNGVPEHNGALRALFTPVEGIPLVFDANNSVSGQLSIGRNDALWNSEKLRAVVSVQDPSSKRSLEAIQVPVSTTTDVQEHSDDSELTFDAELVSISGVVLISKRFAGVADASVSHQILNDYPSGVYYLRIRRGSTVSVQPILYTR